jgi:hypothetical protein
VGQDERKTKEGRQNAGSEGEVNGRAKLGRTGQDRTGRNAGQSVINRSYATPLPADFLIYDSFNSYYIDVLPTHHLLLASNFKHTVTTLPTRDAHSL